MGNGTLYSNLDLPEFHRVIFYPRPDWEPPPTQASDHAISLGGGIHVSARLYPVRNAMATMLFFHGNGEVASDYDHIAPLYNRVNVNLFVADYRGYGRSNGSPSFATLVADAHPVLDHLQELLRRREESASLFVMGRSLGSHPAIELATCCSGRFRGLILESGFAHISRLIRNMGLASAAPGLDAFEKAIDARVKAITIPVLVIHGEEDTLVLPENARHFYENVGSHDKTLLTIPGAGHNDVMTVGMKEYFEAIGTFVARLTPKT